MLLQNFQEGTNTFSIERPLDWVKSHLIDEKGLIKYGYIITAEHDNQEAGIDCDFAKIRISFSEGYYIEYENVGEALDDLQKVLLYFQQGKTEGEAWDLI
jgi:hypothetical protein